MLGCVCVREREREREREYVCERECVRECVRERERERGYLVLGVLVFVLALAFDLLAAPVLAEDEALLALALREGASVCEEGRCKATWKSEFKLPWRVTGPPNHHDDKVDSDQ